MTIASSSSLTTTNVGMQITPTPATQPQQMQVATIAVPQSLSERISNIYTEFNGILKNSAKQNNDAYKVHFKRNQDNILKHAKDLKGSALILGSGNGNDVPLAKLAEQFDKVTLMDIDLEGMQKSIQGLPDGLRSKFHLVKVDLTGILPFISQNIEGLDASMSEEDCITAAINILKESITKGETLNFPEKHNFVVSSMLTGQLFSLVSDYINKVFTEKFPNINANPKLKKIGEEVVRISEHICNAHFDYLAAWTMPKGKIYYADTAYSLSTKLKQKLVVKNNIFDFEYEKVTNARLTFLPIDKINAKIQQIFEQVMDTEEWTWETLLPRNEKGISYHGDIATVRAHYLMTKV